jgi:hypothetical protein
LPKMPCDFNARVLLRTWESREIDEARNILTSPIEIIKVLRCQEIVFVDELSKPDSAVTKTVLLSLMFFTLLQSIVAKEQIEGHRHTMKMKLFRLGSVHAKRIFLCSHFT